MFWIVDNGSSHRGQRSVDRLEGEWPTLRLIHLPVHASWLDQCEIYFSIVQRKVVNPNDFTDLDQIRRAARRLRDTATTRWPNRSTGPSVATTSTSSSPASTHTPRPPERRSLPTIVAVADPRRRPPRPGPPTRASAASNDGPTSTDLQIRYRADFAYVTGTTIDDTRPAPLFRLRYLGSPHDWGFAIYLASKDGYEDSILPAGRFTGTPAEALDCACGLYLNDITAWTDTPDDPIHARTSDEDH